MADEDKLSEIHLAGNTAFLRGNQAALLEALRVPQRIGQSIARPSGPVPAPTLAPPVSVPSAPTSNPFEVLPFPNPGDRIRADDFNTLSKSLRIIYDVYVLSGSLFAVTFAQAKLLLASQQYEIQRVMTVFGTEIDNLTDTSLDNRKVVQVIPTVLGERRLMVVVTEAVETRRFAPNLMGLTYQAASERLRAVLGEITFPTTPTNATQLVGLSLKEAKQILSK
jgi:hypothetical protein